jgi:hypothetical protein
VLLGTFTSNLAVYYHYNEYNLDTLLFNTVGLL